MKKIVDKLPSLASEVGMEEFIRRMDTLKQVHDVWARGGNVIVFDEEDDNIQQLCTKSNPCKYVCMYVCMYITNKMECFSFKSGRAIRVAKLIQE